MQFQRRNEYAATAAQVWRGPVDQWAVRFQERAQSKLYEFSVN